MLSNNGNGTAATAITSMNTAAIAVMDYYSSNKCMAVTGAAMATTESSSTMVAGNYINASGASAVTTDAALLVAALTDGASGGGGGGGSVPNLPPEKQKLLQHQQIPPHLAPPQTVAHHQEQLNPFSPQQMLAAAAPMEASPPNLVAGHQQLSTAVALYNNSSSTNSLIGRCGPRQPTAAVAATSTAVAALNQLVGATAANAGAKLSPAAAVVMPPQSSATGAAAVVMQQQQVQSKLDSMFGSGAPAAATAALLQLHQHQQQAQMQHDHHHYGTPSAFMSLRHVQQQSAPATIVPQVNAGGTQNHCRSTITDADHHHQQQPVKKIRRRRPKDVKLLIPRRDSLPQGVVVKNDGTTTDALGRRCSVGSIIGMDKMNGGIVKLIFLFGILALNSMSTSAVEKHIMCEHEIAHAFINEQSSFAFPLVNVTVSSAYHCLPDDFSADELILAIDIKLAGIQYENLIYKGSEGGRKDNQDARSFALTYIRLKKAPWLKKIQRQEYNVNQLDSQTILEIEQLMRERFCVLKATLLTGNVITLIKELAKELSDRGVVFQADLTSKFGHLKATKTETAKETCKIEKSARQKSLRHLHFSWANESVRLEDKIPYNAQRINIIEMENMGPANLTEVKVNFIREQGKEKAPRHPSQLFRAVFEDPATAGYLFGDQSTRKLEKQKCEETPLPPQEQTVGNGRHSMNGENIFVQQQQLKAEERADEIIHKSINHGGHGGGLMKMSKQILPILTPSNYHTANSLERRRKLTEAQAHFKLKDLLLVSSDGYGSDLAGFQNVQRTDSALGHPSAPSGSDALQGTELAMSSGSGIPEVALADDQHKC